MQQSSSSSPRSKKGMTRFLPLVAVLVVACVAVLVILMRMGLFSSERELGQADIEEILETGYERNFTFVSKTDGVDVSGTSPKLDAHTDAFTYTEHFEHVYQFKDDEGLTCTVYQTYRTEQSGSLKKVNQVTDDYYWQELKPRLNKLVRAYRDDWPGTWKLVDMPLHPRVEVEIGSYSSLSSLRPAIKKLRTAMNGVAHPRENTDAFRRAGSPYEGFEHVPDPLMPRIDILTAKAAQGTPFLLYWYTPFGTKEDFENEISDSALEQLRAVYVRGVNAGTISEKLSSKTIVEHLGNRFTKTQFYLDGTGPSSSNDILWTYSSKEGQLTVPTVALKYLVAGLNGYYQTTQDTKSQRSEWCIGNSYWSATPAEGADGSFDEGTIDLGQVTFTKNDNTLVVFAPGTSESMQRTYTATQLEQLLDVKITVDLDSSTVKLTMLNGDVGVGVGAS